jgi:methyl-accepting chemotaxis protein
MKGPVDKQVIPKSYLRGFVIRGSFLFTAGLILISTILYYSSQQTFGPSYQGSFVRLAQLQHEMLYKSMLIYFAVMLVVSVGVAFITMVYSHRVVGPLIAFKRVIGLIALGDLTDQVVLRSHDVIKPAAESFNCMIGSYRNILDDLRNKTRELGNMTTGDDALLSDDEIKKRIRSIADILEKIKLE